MSTTTTTSEIAVIDEREALTPSKTKTMPRQKGHKELVAQEKMLISLKANMLDLVIESVCGMLPRLGEKIEVSNAWKPPLPFLCAPTYLSLYLHQRA